MTNDEKNTQVLLTLSVFVRLKKERQQQREERSQEQDSCDHFCTLVLNNFFSEGKIVHNKVYSGVGPVKD